MLSHESSNLCLAFGRRHFAACSEALQVCLTKHKAENAAVTKKRHKKEVIKLFGDMLEAVTDLAG